MWKSKNKEHKFKDLTHQLREFKLKTRLQKNTRKKLMNVMRKKSQNFKKR